MKTLKIGLLLLLAVFSTVSCFAITKGSAKEQMQSAKSSKEMILLVVKDKESSTEKLLGIVNDVVKTTRNVKVVEMDMSDEKNVDLVKEYRLSGAPMPLVLVFSNSGVVLGGMIETQITKESLIEALPTPMYNEIVGAISLQKPIFTVVSNAKFKSDKFARELCNAAKKEMAGKAEVIIVDTEDAKESKLITMLNIKNKLEDTFIVAINGQGMMAGRFDVLPTQAALIEAATKVVQSGCAPGGCTPSCK